MEGKDRMELIFQTPACPFEEISHSLSKSWSNERSDRVIKDKQRAPPSCLALGPTAEPDGICLTPRHLPTCSRSEKNTNTNTNTTASSLTYMQVRALPAVPVVGRQILCSRSDNEEGKLLALVNGNPEKNLQIIDKIKTQRQDTIKKEKDCWRQLSCVGGDMCTWQSPPENLHIQLALSLNTNTNTNTYIQICVPVKLENCLRSQPSLSLLASVTINEIYQTFAVSIYAAKDKRFYEG